MGQSQGWKEKGARHHYILAWSAEESESSEFEPGPLATGSSEGLELMLAGMGAEIDWW